VLVDKGEKRQEEKGKREREERQERESEERKRATDIRTKAISSAQSTFVGP